MLEAFRMIAHDRGWLRRLREAVSSGLTAEAAVERVQNDARAKLQRQTDPYLRDRLHDLTDIANRLLHQLAGQSLVVLPEELPENAILVARSMSPAALLDYDRARLRGLVLEEGGRVEPHRHRRSRAVDSRRQRHRQYFRDRRAGRRDHRRRRHGRDLPAPAGGRRGGLRGKGADARPATGAVSRPSRRADGQPRRRVDRPAHERRPAGRHAPPRRNRREVDRPLPHRVAVHAGLALSPARRAAAALPRHPRRRRRPDGHLPHARHRRRQAPALYEGPGGGKPRARLAGASHRARSPAAAPDAVSRLHPRRRRARPQGHGPDGVDRRRIQDGPRDVRSRARLEREPRVRAAAHGQSRRHGRSAVAVVADSTRSRRPRTSSRSARTT